jgi:RimJ/RimL family protein N-acetyltransferase
MLQGRLVELRDYRRKDVEALFELETDPEVVSLTDTRPFRARPLAALLAEYDRRLTEPDGAAVTFAIQRLDDESGAAVGRIVLWGVDEHQRTAHVGVSLLPSVRGQGLGRDAVEVICRVGFDSRGLERLSLETLEVNGPMRATALACGFVEEARLRGAAWHLGRRVDEMVYGMLAHEWRTRRAAAQETVETWNT